MAWMPNGVGPCARARLQIEALEVRAMLAIAGFEFNLFADDGGAPGEAILADTVQVGDSFFVEITAADQRSDATGLAGRSPGIRGLALDLAWNPEIFEVLDDPFDPVGGIVTESLPLFRNGTLDNGAGRIDELQGAMSLSSAAGEPIGGERPERFALLRFRALQATEASALSMRLGSGQLSMFPSVLFIQSSDVDFETQIISVVEQAESDDDSPGEAIALSELTIDVYQGAAGGSARSIVSDAVNAHESFLVDVIVAPAPEASRNDPQSRLDVASLEPFANQQIDLAAGELLLTRLVVDVGGVAVDLPLAIGPLDDATFDVETTRRITLSYRPPPPVAAAADAALAATSGEELAAAANPAVEHALLQALASGLAVRLAQEEPLDPFSNRLI